MPIWKKAKEFFINKQFARRYNKISYLGIINALSGKTYSYIIENTNVTAGIIEAVLRYFIPILQEENPGRKILFILDNAAYHKTNSIIALQKELNFEFFFLPPYCPHLNRQEHVNAYIKRKVSEIYHYYSSQINNFKDESSNMLFKLTEFVLESLSKKSFYSL